MKQRFKALLHRVCPPAVTAGWWVKRRLPIYLLGVPRLAVDSVRPESFSQWSHFRKQARATRQLRDERIKRLNGSNQKILIIKINHSNAGFFAYLTFVFNQLIYCEKQNYLPVVYFGRRAGNGINAYYDPRYGPNMWDYFFEPVAGINYEDVLFMVNRPDSVLRKADLLELSYEQLKYLHMQEPDSVFAFPYGVYYSKTQNDLEWYRTQRSKAHGLIKKYIRLKKHIQEEIDAFYDQHMKGAFVVGAHVRGTDKGTPRYADAGRNPNTMRIIEPTSYFERIDPFLNQHPECKIFVATDQEQYLQSFKNRYGERVIAWNSLRSRTKTNVFQQYDFNGYRKGKDVLIETQLLARTQFFLKCASAVGEAALWFNPDLEYVDMNYAA